MLSRYASGATLTISCVAAGTGTVSQATLPDQTSLFNQKQSAAPVDLVREGNRVTVKMEFPAVGDAYTMNQIGVFASVNGEAEQLLAIYQDESGIPIPAASSTQSFLLTFYGGITIENNGAVTITIDSGTYATMGTLVEYLARKQDRITAVGLLKRNQKGEVVAALPGEDYASIENLNTKQNTLTLDQQPTEDSQNFVNSGAVFAWVTQAITAAIANVGGFVVSATPPTNVKMLWIDTAAVTGGLKCYDETKHSWVHVAVAYHSNT